MDVRRRNRHGLEYGGEINIDDLQPRAVAPPPKWRRVVENSLWLSAASYILYYGDSHSNFFTVLTSNPRIVRRPFFVGLICVGINTLIFFYLAVWLRHVKKKDDDWEEIAPGAIPTATILGVAAFLMFIFALWPVWGFLTIPLLVTLFMAFVIISPYLPPYKKTNKDGSRAD
ncbi:hypothetical protein MPTK1_2g08160 [Marchantia polymorpha subsp. ruderalis]|uniref:Transmembrane protein 128 n=2 Tax=Marchantia polymorpha TaxID=3197 RepID=A0A176WH86_MARPO|nr:hypothetical protein AXG93_3384s1390 [Marchantia polymorpha subsp. ruderalis]PTQ45303.1 hypothetical protein MARPO_0015s0101 [Marchantia polymorpha]BBN01534.1 hypothetical protein Mp_2g08160 [Marchantia polymorpha subsp. ruderalis]|eukprot:PTQ45303.1 hypothetical protein MARPO_0015s0101 [Marchantia polymorpha]